MTPQELRAPTTTPDHQPDTESETPATDALLSSIQSVDLHTGGQLIALASFARILESRLRAAETKLEAAESAVRRLERERDEAWRKRHVRYGNFVVVRYNGRVVCGKFGDHGIYLNHVGDANPIPFYEVEPLFEIEVHQPFPERFKVDDFRKFVMSTLADAAMNECDERAC